MIVLGNVHFGAGVLLAISYQSIDQMGFIPRKISLFMETHMPKVALIGHVVSGTIIIKILTAPMLLSYIPGISRFLEHKGDAFLQKLLPETSNIKLTDIDAPVVVNKNLNFKEIETILEARRSQYEINPSHCSKSVVGGSEYPRDNQFEKYNTLFDKINWNAKYKQLSPRLKDDERFIDFLKETLKETHIDISQEDLKKNFDFYVNTLATKKGISKEVYLASWAKKQMEILVDNLTGSSRVTGRQQDLDDALQSLSIILAQLEKIQLSDRVQFEDILIKLAVEGGGYCSRGIKRAAEDIVFAMPQLGHTKKDAEIDAKKLYELKLEGVLQRKRHAIMQGKYQEGSEQIPQAISQDVHAFDMFRELLSLGFYPLSELERKAIPFPVFINRHIRKELMSGMYSEYESSLDECIKETGELDFSTYIRDVINSNESLSEQQRMDLEEMMGDRNKDFHLLALVMLGVLRKK